MCFEQEPNEGHPDCHAILGSFRANLRINRTNSTVCKKSAYISYQQKQKKGPYRKSMKSTAYLSEYMCYFLAGCVIWGFESGPVLAREPLRHSPSNSPFWDPPNDDGDTRHRSGQWTKKRWQVPKTGGKDAAFGTGGLVRGEVDLADDALPRGCRALISPCWECSRRVRLK